MSDKSPEQQEYSMSIRLLGNEIFAISLSSTSTSSKWIAIAIVSMFSLLTVLGAYGEKFISLFQMLTG